MRAFSPIAVALSLFAAGCGTLVSAEQERSALMDADRAWAQSVKDMDAYMAYWAPDAVLYPPEMPMAEGTPAIRKLLTQIFATPGFSIEWTPAAADISTSGDLGYTTGTYAITVNDAAGQPRVEKGKYVTVWKKQADGQWRAARDIFNGDAPRS